MLQLLVSPYAKDVQPILAPAHQLWHRAEAATLGVPRPVLWIPLQGFEISI